MFVRLLAIAGLIGSSATEAANADDILESARQVAECRSITEDSTRLSCLDVASTSLALALEQAGSSGLAAAVPDPVPESSAEPKWAKAPEPPVEPKADKDGAPIWTRVFQRPKQEEKDDDVYAVTITRITRNNVGRHFFHTSEGQVWRQTVVESVRPPKSLPAEATIEKRVLGNPALKFSGGPKGEYTVRRTE